MKERLLAAAGPLATLALFVAAIAILERELASYHIHDVLARLHAIGKREIAVAIALTAFGYFSLTGYDALALRWIHHSLAYPRVALASFIAYAFGHNLGPSFLGGSAVRYRMFTTWGLTPSELARAIGFNAITFWLGFLALGAVTLTAEPIQLPSALHALVTTSRPLGLAFAGALALYLGWVVFGPRRVRVRGSDFELPSLPMTGAQIALSALDWTLAASVFWILLPAVPELSPARALGAFLIAQVIGLVSHVPAGLGVFEGVMVLLLAPWLSGEAVLGAAIAYRLVYYVLPMALAIGLFTAFELGQRQVLARRVGRVVARFSSDLAPRAFAITTFAAGLILLLSGAVPAAPGRLEVLERLLPLPVLEVSHLLASLVGVALLLLARAIQQRVDAGYALALVGLAAGAVFSLLKGFDWEEATILSAMFLALLPCRRFFYRRSSLLSQSLTPSWTTGILVSLIGTAFVVMLAYRHVEYSNELWWQFELHGHAPRSLRALAGGAGLLAFFAAARLLRPATPVRGSPSSTDLQRALPIVRNAATSSAHLALVGDKQLLFHESGAGFVMYSVSGRCWVAMGDPIGSPGVRRELAWRFHELVDAHRGLTVFYEVGTEDLPIYLDLGLSLRKLGEEARVRLRDFSIGGGARKGLRHTLHRMEREGASFELLPAEAVPKSIDELQAVSDAWLASKNTREKRFSLGSFDPAYLSRTPVAVVRREGRIVAFANIWAPDAREECSLDLMRYDDTAPRGVMDFLFTELLLWSQKQGYHWFSLGMAPLSGFEHHRLAPQWNRLGALLFRHGENFYHFRGLRAFKEKFDPVWEPRYLAAPQGLTLPIVLTRIAALISGGVTGVLAK